MMAVKTVTAATVYHPDWETTEICYVADTTSNVMTIKLGTAKDSTGQTIFVKKYVAAGSLTVSASTGQTIDGSGSLAATDIYARIRLVSNGANWDVISLKDFA